jgi:hypothetical protein
MERISVRGGLLLVTSMAEITESEKYLSSTANIAAEAGRFG